MILRSCHPSGIQPIKHQLVIVKKRWADFSGWGKPRKLHLDEGLQRMIEGEKDAQVIMHIIPLFQGRGQLPRELQDKMIQNIALENTYVGSIAYFSDTSVLFNFKSFHLISSGLCTRWFIYCCFISMLLISNHRNLFENQLKQSIFNL